MHNVNASMLVCAFLPDAPYTCTRPVQVLICLTIHAMHELVIVVACIALLPVTGCELRASAHILT